MLAEIAQIGRAAGRDDGDLEPVLGETGSDLIEIALGFRHLVLWRVEEQAVEAQTRVAGNASGEGDGLAGCLDPGPLTAGITLDQDADITASLACRIGVVVDGHRVVGAGPDGGPVTDQPCQAGHLLLAQKVVADQDIVEAASHHHLGLAELLARDALRPGITLHGGEYG